MTERNNYFYQTNHIQSDKTPLIYLHGSARSEADGADFIARLAMGRTGLFLRGPYSQGRGYTFIRRNDNRSLNYEEIAADAKDLAAFLASPHMVDALDGKPPILIGYSSGAIIAAAMLWQNPSTAAGAVLLRPQSPSLQSPAPVGGLPILILSGLTDERRDPEAADKLEDQFQSAKARVTHVRLQTGHGEAMDGSDLTYTRNWIEESFPK